MISWGWRASFNTKEAIKNRLRASADFILASSTSTGYHKSNGWSECEIAHENHKQTRNTWVSLAGLLTMIYFSGGRWLNEKKSRQVENVTKFIIGIYEQIIQVLILSEFMNFLVFFFCFSHF